MFIRGSAPPPRGADRAARAELARRRSACATAGGAVPGAPAPPLCGILTLSCLRAPLDSGAVLGRGGGAGFVTTVTRCRCCAVVGRLTGPRGEKGDTILSICRLSRRAPSSRLVPLPLRGLALRALRLACCTAAHRFRRLTAAAEASWPEVVARTPASISVARRFAQYSCDDLDMPESTRVPWRRLSKEACSGDIGNCDMNAERVTRTLCASSPDDLPRANRTCHGIAQQPRRRAAAGASSPHRGCGAATCRCRMPCLARAASNTVGRSGSHSFFSSFRGALASGGFETASIGLRFTCASEAPGAGDSGGEGGGDEAACAHKTRRQGDDDGKQNE